MSLVVVWEGVVAEAVFTKRSASTRKATLIAVTILLLIVRAPRILVVRRLLAWRTHVLVLTLILLVALARISLRWTPRLLHAAIIAHLLSTTLVSVVLVLVIFFLGLALIKRAPLTTIVEISWHFKLTTIKTSTVVKVRTVLLSGLTRVAIISEVIAVVRLLELILGPTVVPVVWSRVRATVKVLLGEVPRILLLVARWIIVRNCALWVLAKSILRVAALIVLVIVALRSWPVWELLIPVALDIVEERLWLVELVLLLDSSCRDCERVVEAFLVAAEYVLVGFIGVFGTVSGLVVLDVDPLRFFQELIWIELVVVKIQVVVRVLRHRDNLISNNI